MSAVWLHHFAGGFGRFKCGPSGFVNTPSYKAFRKQIPIVEGHLWKAQWKVKPNDEGHKKLTMNS